MNAREFGLSKSGKLAMIAVDQKMRIASRFNRRLPSGVLLKQSLIRGVKGGLLISGWAAAITCLLVACTHTAPETTASVEKLDPAQLKTLIEKEENLFFLDVRDPMEIQELGTLPGYVNIPIDQLESRLEEIPRDTTIVTA